MDAITVAQALHWFSTDFFWSEVRRKLKPGGVFMAFGYSWLGTNTEVDSLLISKYRKLIQNYWKPNNALLWEGYEKTIIPFPLKRMEVPGFNIIVQWSPKDIFDYMLTWSASQGYIQENGIDKLQELLDQTSEKFSLDEKLEVIMPLTVIAGVN